MKLLTKIDLVIIKLYIRLVKVENKKVTLQVEIDL